MKTHFIVSAFLVLSLSLSLGCGEGSSASNTNIDIAKGKKIMGANDCATCHKETEKMVGPSFADIAKKYENTPENVEKLCNSIIKGSSGIWGETPMVAHTKLAKEDAQELVKYILSIK